MSTPIENNTGALQEILQTVNDLPDAGGGGQFVVNFSGDEFVGFTADKTFAQIQDAYNEGKTVVGVWNDRVLTLTFFNSGGCGFWSFYQEALWYDTCQIILTSQNETFREAGYGVLNTALPGMGASDYTTYCARYISLQQDEVTTAPANGELVGVYTVS